MSKRSWSGLWLTPWLMATSGCTTLPFGHSASKAPLPTDRKLAIAQTFERQGHDAKARQVYEQILAAEPKSVIAAERLETLIAKSDGSTNGRLAQAKRNSANRSTMSRTFAATPTLRETIAEASKSQSPVIEPVAARKPPLPAPVDSQNVEVKSATELATSRSNEIPESTPQLPNGQAEVPPSPNLIVAKSTPTTTIEEEAEIFWELPEKRTSAAENATSDAGPREPTASHLIEGETSESLVTEFESPPPLQKGEVLVQKYEHLFADIAPTTLGEMREESRELQDVLSSIAVDSSVLPSRRARAIFLLGQMGPQAKQVVTSLEQVISSSSDTSLRMETAEAILMIQSDNVNAVNLLLESLNSEDPKVKWYAAFALRLASSSNPKYVNLAVARLVFATAEGDIRLRRMAMLSLGAFGRSATNAVPTLKFALNDTDEMTRVIAATSLNLITEQSDVVPQFVSRHASSFDQ